jgi:hypothetical protein
MNLCPGDVLALRYKVKRRIGGGSFGEIYIGKLLIGKNIVIHICVAIAVD